MERYDVGDNVTVEKCRDCNCQLPPGSGIVYEVWGYNWDDPDENAQGSITVKLDRYVLCRNATTCAERVVATGTHIDALRRVAQDRENLGDLADRARTILVDIAQIQQQLCLGDDLTARESGYGAIGGYRG